MKRLSSRMVVAYLLILIPFPVVLGQARQRPRPTPQPKPAPAVVAPSAPPRAVSVRLKTGAPVNGQFISADSSSVYLDVAGNRLVIKLDDVASIVFDETRATEQASPPAAASDGKAEAAQSALKALRRLAGAVEVGINFQGYGTRLIDTKSEVDEALGGLSEGELKDALAGAMEAYVDAGQLWNAMLNPRYDFILHDHYAIAQKVAKKYNIPIDRSGSYPVLRGRDRILSIIWTAARAEIERAAALSQ